MSLKEKLIIWICMLNRIFFLNEFDLVNKVWLISFLVNDIVLRLLNKLFLVKYIVFSILVFRIICSK